MINKKEISNRCQGCPAFEKSFFNGLRESQARGLRENAISLSFRKGQNITVRNSDCQGMFCIRSGFAKVYLNSPQEENITVGLRISGEILGHHELLGKENIFSVSSLTDVEACFFPKRIVLSKFERVAAFSKKILSDLNSDLAEIGSYLLALSCKSIKQRTAWAILYLKEKTGTTENGTIALQLSRQELSDMVGASRESVHRELAFFKKKKWIDLDTRSIRIVDETGLKQTAKL